LQTLLYVTVFTALLPRPS